MHTFILCFAPLFVAMDVIGNLPIYMSMTSEMSKAESSKVARLAGMTALAVGLLFMWFGHQLLGALNISAADFKIAGGLVLLIFAINGILHDAPRHSGIVKEHVGVVPIGVPMMVGPATLVTLLLLADLYPAWAVSSGLVVNILLSLVIFRTHRLWERIFHANGIRAISKIVHFFLAAIAVMMIRVGIMEVLG